jgi:hypothetical protein
MTSRPGTYDAGPHLPPSGPGGRPRGVINPKRATGAHRKDATSTPTFRRTHHHLPEDGLGGSDWYVTYRGELIGFVYSTWDRRGVHFRTRTPDYETVTELGSEVPRAFDTRAEAVMYLLDIEGIDFPEPITYDLTKGPRGGGEDRPDRRY